MSTSSIAPGVEQALSRAAECLRHGGLVAFPTDTLYGLGALASDDGAVWRLFEAKRRAGDKPLPLLVASADDLGGIADYLPAAGERLTREFWPGALTIVVRRAPIYSSPALAGADTVAVRVPDHPIALALIRRAGGAVTGTSANVAGGSAPRDAADVRRQLGDAVDFLVEGGPEPAGVASTVVDLTGGSPRILREGAISRDAVEAVLSPTALTR